MTVIPTGYAQANFVFSGAPVPTGAEVTLGIDLDAYAGTPDDLASDLFTVWDDNIMPRLVSAISLSEVRTKFGPVSTGPSGSFTGAGGGGAGGAGASSAVSMLVRKTTAFGGRAGTGRMYIPGLQESDIDAGGNVDSGALSAWTSSLSAFLSDLIVANAVPVLLHGVGSPLTTPSFVTSFVADGTVATQRRRQRR